MVGRTQQGQESGWSSGGKGRLQIPHLPGIQAETKPGLLLLFSTELRHLDKDSWGKTTHFWVNSTHPTAPRSVILSGD